MNELPVNTLRWTLKVTVLLSVLGGLVAISQSSLAEADELILTALAFDLLISFPVIYLAMIRKTAVPLITVVPVFFACFLIASAVLPDSLAFLGYAGIILIPAVEIAGLTYLGLRIYRTRRVYLAQKETGLDLMERLRRAFECEMKPAAIARAAAFEVAVFGYLLFIWHKPAQPGFTYHRKNGSQVLLSVLLFLIVVETIGTHLLLSLWNTTLASVVTALGAYFVFQIVAHLKAVSLRPILVTDHEVLLRCGLLGDAAIPKKIIDSVETVTASADPTSYDLIPLGGMSTPNIRLSLREPVSVFGIYGIKKEATVFRISLDDPTAFIEALKL